jgi:periplasmic divalent cation tolerance protein
MTDYRVVLCTCPDEACGQELAGALVEEKLAACVNIIPGIKSVYAWKGAIETDPECLLVIKTRQACYARLETRLQALHPYELPEIISVPIEAGLAGYLAWITAATTDK